MPSARARTASRTHLTRTPCSWGDWANYIPGPYGFQTPEYPQFFYIRALEITTKFATRLGFSADAAYYGGLATAARALYQSTYFNSTTSCYAGCTYVSQVFALTLGLAGPQGSPTEQAVWANAMSWWAANATHGLAEHFGGGIISLKYSLPLLDAHGNTGLALKMHMQTDRAPGFGYWITTGGATTLWAATTLCNGPPGGVLPSVVLGVTLVVAGHVLRTLTFDGGALSTALFVLSYVLNAESGPVAMGAVRRLSEAFFPPDQCATATAVMAEATLLGVAGAMLFGPLIVQAAVPEMAAYNYAILGVLAALLLAGIVGGWAVSSCRQRSCTTEARLRRGMGLREGGRDGVADDDAGNVAVNPTLHRAPLRLLLARPPRSWRRPSRRARVPLPASCH